MHVICSTAAFDALNCAIEMQRAALATNDPIPPKRRLELRIGVNLGDVIVDGDNIFGDGINIAARLQALAKPGTICISQTVYEQVGETAERGNYVFGDPVAEEIMGGIARHVFER